MSGSCLAKDYPLGACSPSGEPVILQRGGDAITAPAQRMPITVITGFWESGKAMLLNHILNNAQGLKVAVLVNQFGDIEMNAQRVVSEQNDRIELSNGCVYCTISGSLVDTVSWVIEHEDQVDYLVIETDELADPLSIVTTFRDAALKEIARLDSVLGVVNAETFGLPLLKHSVYVNQLIYSDVIVLDTTNLISADKVSAIEQDIHLLKSGAQILSCSLQSASHLPLLALLDVGLA
ncbi:MAG: GTP-binding protein, partial [Cyanobacteria bacterium P01_F01_bin.3]